ncbi:uncharacterized protein LOC105845096 isoform X1 [Hydra vulgaris]|uniref:uncharacterized protein LOC105845096 isoform X1 n=1 Tax=Hydra vulgaris TaxID=6087 RepID=UPI001F5FE851|nr:uncharacterized protein LOC105845096 isoform X1 [Hydra vulgaris]
MKVLQFLFLNFVLQSFTCLTIMDGLFREIQEILNMKRDKITRLQNSLNEQNMSLELSSKPGKINLMNKSTENGILQQTTLGFGSYQNLSNVSLVRNISSNRSNVTTHKISAEVVKSNANIIDREDKFDESSASYLGNEIEGSGKQDYFSFLKGNPNKSIDSYDHHSIGTHNNISAILNHESSSGESNEVGLSSGEENKHVVNSTNLYEKIDKHYKSNIVRDKRFNEKVFSRREQKTTGWSAKRIDIDDTRYTSLCNHGDCYQDKENENDQNLYNDFNTENQTPYYHYTKFHHLKVKLKGPGKTHEEWIKQEERDQRLNRNSYDHLSNGINYDNVKDIFV